MYAVTHNCESYGRQWQVVVIHGRGNGEVLASYSVTSPDSGQHYWCSDSQLHSADQTRFLDLASAR